MVTTAIQRGNFIYVYDGTRQLFSQQGELSGYTSTSVSVKRGTYIYVYNEKGQQISSHYCG